MQGQTRTHKHVSLKCSNDLTCVHLKHLDIKPSEFLMVGNSLKSDILPLVNIGAEAIHVPFHTTWQHEKVSKNATNGLKYKTVESLSDILNVLK